MFKFKQIHFLASFLFIVFVMGTAVFAQEASQLLSLDDCINIALEKNSDLRVSRLSDESADKDVLGSYSGILPSISVSASKGNYEIGPSEYRDDVPVGVDSATGRIISEERLITQSKASRASNNIGLSIDQNIFDGGIWWNSIRKAKTDKKSAEYSLLSTKNNVILQVEQAYFNLNKQIKLLEVYQVAVSRSQGQLDRTQKMYELGATAQLDVFQSRVNLGNDRISLLQQKNAVDQARKNLNLAMGRDPFTPLQVNSEINLESDLPESDELIQKAFDNQPVV
ncbi:MAG: TolC family protein, partial [Calditrichaceae bacterium]